MEVECSVCATIFTPYEIDWAECPVCGHINEVEDY